MKQIKIILFLLITFNTSLKANSSDNVQSILSEGGKLIFIRHAYAPGGGDPDNFDLLNCASIESCARLHLGAPAFFYFVQSWEGQGIGDRRRRDPS